MNLKRRVFDGPVKEAGDWEDDRYREEIEREHDVDVTLERFYGPPGRLGGSKMDEIAEDGVHGQEALATVEEYVEDDAFADLGFDDVMESYEHRGRGRDEVVTVEGGYSFIGHRNMYRVRFEF